MSARAEGFLLALSAVVAAALLIALTITIDHLVDRAQGGSQAYHYLYDPLPNIKGPKGEAVRRVDILDAAMEDFLRRQAQAAK